MQGNTFEISRRSFIAGAAATAAAATACAAGTAIAQEASSISDDWDEEFDIVIVGSGIAGLAAASTVITEGDGMSCLLVEKEDRAAGCSPWCHSDALYTDDVEGTFQYLREMEGVDSFQVTPDAPLHAFAEGIAENLDWIHSLGATGDELVAQTAGDIDTTGSASDATSGLLSFAPEWPEYKHSRCVADWWFNADNENVNHSHIWNFLDEYVSNYPDQVDYRKDFPFTDFVQDPETRTILGVIANGEKIKANKGVVMCIGGFEHDPWMMQNDGHKVFDEVSQQTNDPATLPYHVGFRHGASQFGGEWRELPMPSKGWYIFDQDGLDAGALSDVASENHVGDGWVYTADSIEDLAGQIGVDPDELTKTVDYRNELCDCGEDAAFYRPADTLVKIVKAPFYAQLCRSGYLNTDGCSVRDEKARILDPDGNPIPHLYSAGEFGSMFGRHYQGNGNVSECLAFGRIAIRSIVAGE